MFSRAHPGGASAARQRRTARQRHHARAPHDL